MPAMSRTAWPRSDPGALEQRLAASGLSSRNTNGMMISKKSMRTKTATATTWVAVEVFLATRLPAASPGAGTLIYGADQHGQARAWAQRALAAPSVLFFWLLVARLLLGLVLALAMQAFCREQVLRRRAAAGRGSGRCCAHRVWRRWGSARKR